VVEAVGDARQLVAFQVDGHDYALPLEQVHEVLRMVALIPVPEAPPWVAGVANVRGDVIPVIDLRPRLGLEPTDPDPGNVIVVASSAQRTLGVLADRVLGVTRLPVTPIGLVDPSASAHGFAGGISRSGPNLVLVVDLDKLAPVAAPT
jgi:purine-binding chemotaxis protein CheW